MKLIITVLFMVFYSYTTCAEEQPAVETIAPLIIGVAKTDSYAALTLSEGFCDEKEVVKISEEETLIIAGLKACTPKYGSAEIKYYIIGYKGKERYIKQDNIYLLDKDLKKLEAATESEIEKIRSQAIMLSEQFYNHDRLKLLEKLNSTKKSGVTILKYQVFDESEYTEGTGVEIEYYNPTNKIIKYITANFVGYNGVNDPVRAAYSRSNVVTLKGVGPINPKEVGSYKKTYAWDTDIVETAKITSVKILYMDGTSSNIKNPASVTLDSKSYELLMSLE